MSFENKSSETPGALSPEMQTTLKGLEQSSVDIFKYFTGLTEPWVLDNQRLVLLAPLLGDVKIIKDELTTLHEEISSQNLSHTEAKAHLNTIKEKIDYLSGLKKVAEDLVEMLLSKEAEEAFASGGEVVIDFYNPDGITVVINKNEEGPEAMKESEIVKQPSAETPESAKEPIIASDSPLSLYEMADSSVLYAGDNPEAGLKALPQIETELKELFSKYDFGVAGDDFLKSRLATAKTATALFFMGGKEDKITKVEKVYFDLLSDVSAFIKTAKVDKESSVANLEAPIEDGAADVEEDIKRNLEAFALFEANLESDSHIRATSEFRGLKQAVSAFENYQQADPVRAANDRSRMLGVLQKKLAALSEIIKDISPIEKVEAEAVALDVTTEVTPKEPISFSDEKDIEAPSAFDDAPHDFGLPAWYAPESVEGMPEMDAKADEESAVDVLPQTKSTPDATVATESEPKVSLVEKDNTELGQRREQGQDRLKQKQEFREKEKAYLAQVDEYYKGEGIKSLARSGFKNALEFVGLKPKLSPALEALRQEYNSARQLYAASLQQALDDRGVRRDIAGLESTDYVSDGEKFKQVFANNFIFKPQERLLLAQERNLLSPEQRQRLARMTAFMSKNKQLTRVGIVVAAGIAAGLSGGVGAAMAGASWQASRMAASSAAGAGAAWLTQKSFASKVEAKNENLTQTKLETVSKFDVSKLEQLEQNLRQAEVEARTAKTQQKVATVGAAVAAGGLTGYGLGSLENVTEKLDSFNQALENGGVGVVEDITVRIEGLEDAALSQVVLSDISLGENVNLDALSDTEWSLLDGYLKQKAADLLSAHPNLSEVKLETELFKALENKFGNADWWQGSGIEKVDIGEIRNIDAGTTVGATNEAVITETETEAVSESVLKSSEYLVKPNDTLGEIIMERYPEKFAGLSEVQRSQALSTLFDKLQADSTMVEKLGLRSGDIDLLYPGEKIDLQAVESLLDKDISAISGAKTGALNIEVDSDVKSVPIKIIEKEISGGTEVEFENMPYTEAAPVTTPEVTEPIPPFDKGPINPNSVVVDKLPSMSKVFALNGQYLDHPDYIKYSSEVFGSGKGFEQAVERSIKAFDNETYDFVDSLGGGYESPYRLIGEMSLKDLAEFANQPGEDLRYFLSQNNIKYETYLAWVDKVNELKEKFPYQDTTKVADLFGREVIDDKVLNMAKALKK